MDDLDSLVRQLHREPRRSRNRHFEELSQPAVLRALRVVRRLDRLAHRLKSAGAVSVARGGRGVVITLAIAAVRYREETHLSTEEHALLSLDPLLRGKLALP